MTPTISFTSTPTATQTSDLTPTQTPTLIDSLTETPTDTPFIPDLNEDDQVNEDDLLQWLNALGDIGSVTDINGDGVKDYRDIFGFSLWWNQ